MTFLQQQSKLSRVIGDPNTSADDIFPLADRKAEINRGEVLFANTSRSLLRYATGTISSQTISLPSGFIAIHELVVNDENMTGLREMPLQNWERNIDSGENRYYFWANASGTREIKFIDSASDGLTYKLWYFSAPTSDLSGDSDESPFEDQYREASVYYAASEFMITIGKFQMAEYFRSRFFDMANEARLRTEELYLNSQRVYPDISDQPLYDKDKEGIGAQPQ